jgi:hypothetical protein
MRVVTALIAYFLPMTMGPETIADFKPDFADRCEWTLSHKNKWTHTDLAMAAITAP